MDITVTDAAPGTVSADWLIVGVNQSQKLEGTLAGLDMALGGAISRVMEHGDATGKCAELLALYETQSISARRVLLVGLGKQSELGRQSFEKAMMTAVRKVSSKKDVSVAVAMPDLTNSKLSVEQAAETLAFALRVGPQGQDALKAEPAHFPLRSAEIIASSEEQSRSVAGAVERGGVLGDAVNFARRLVDTPPQQLYPETFADEAVALAGELGLACEVFDEEQLRAERMGSLLAVAQGSTRPPRVVAVSYRGATDDAPVLALVGKGVTYDSGGLSLKPTDNMLTMKCDMAGAATVLATVSAIARLKLPVNVTAWMGLVENMVSGSSYKLGDILTARNGVTIEVQNTDAEGRLVLADVLCLAVDRGAERLIDVATLTGACVVALGETVTGVFSNNTDWSQRVLDAANTVGEDAWPLPMFDHYSELLKSDVADCRNIGGRWGGAITAAKFLEKFVSERPWVHLDIAGPSFASSNKPAREGGATGCMVRTLVETAARL